MWSCSHVAVYYAILLAFDIKVKIAIILACSRVVRHHTRRHGEVFNHAHVVMYYAIILAFNVKVKCAIKLAYGQLVT